MLTYRILEDYTDDVYQLSLASRKGGLYVERIRKRQDLKNKVLYYWQEGTTFATLTREKIDRNMRDADHFNALQESCQLPEEEKASHHCTTKRSEKSGLCHTLLKKLNAHKNDKCWSICNVTLCFQCIVNIHCV